jgi:D-galactose 1-dehydrogenase
MSDGIRIGLVGVGKIARDQHIPSIRADPTFELVGAVSRHGADAALVMYPTLDAMLEARPDIEAVALCTPPQVRHALAQTAIARGKHVFLEKPPGATLSEVESLRMQAEQAGVTLFAGWHSRFAPAVEPARSWLAGRRVTAARIDWREDVRHWHPGQAWIWEPGGLGVFDPGINALSIATAILPKSFFLKEAELRFPSNRGAPIAADLVFQYDTDVEIVAGFDWLQTGPQTWDIRVDTDGGRLTLSRGGGLMSVNGETAVEAVEAEYPGLYRRFAQLVRTGASEVDVRPLRHVADAFLCGRRVQTAAFED